MSKARDKINELTAQAMHVRGGWDLDVCRTDALMKHGLWVPQDAIEGLIRYAEELDDAKSIEAENAVPQVPGPEAA